MSATPETPKTRVGLIETDHTPQTPTYRVDLVNLATGERIVHSEGGAGFERPTQPMPGYALQYVYNNQDTVRRYHPDDCPHEHGDLVQTFTATITRWYSANLGDLPADPADVLSLHGDEEIAGYDNDEWYFQCRDCGDTLIPLRMTDAGTLTRKEV